MTHRFGLGCTRTAGRLAAVALGLWSSAAAALDPADVRKAAEYSAAHRGLSLLVIQGRETIHESYPNWHSAGERHKIYSGTKAFWNLAALAAVEEGWLRLDERVAETIGEWREDAGKARVTVRQLVDFSSGLDPGMSLHANDPGDRGKMAIALPLVAEPGSTFIYGPASLQVLHEVLERKLTGRGETPVRYLERKVLKPLGLGAQRHLRDRAGNPLLATGWMLAARQWAGLGRLALAGGAPVVGSGVFTQSWRGSGANRAFSLGWWNNRAAPGGREFDIEDMLERDWQRQSWRGTCICRDAPDDLVACLGSGYQRLFVIPSMDLVVVRQGEFGKFSDGQFLRLLLGSSHRAMASQRALAATLGTPRAMNGPAPSSGLPPARQP